MAKLIAIFAALPLLLGGCLGSSAAPPASASRPPDAPAIATADMVILTGARAFAVAELTYKTAAEAAIALIDAGVLRGQDAATVRDIALNARTWLERGKATRDMAVQARAAAALLGYADLLAPYAPRRRE